MPMTSRAAAFVRLVAPPRFCRANSTAHDCLYDNLGRPDKVSQPPFERTAIWQPTEHAHCHLHQRLLIAVCCRGPRAFHSALPRDIAIAALLAPLRTDSEVRRSTHMILPSPLP
jgi:hypothetical protein